MEVRLIKELAIRNYCRKNARALPSFHIFLEKLKGCDWSDLNDIKADFPSMSIVGDCENDRIVFDIGGNNYRLICDYNFYENCCLFIAFIGTHAEYDKVDACTVQLF